MVKPTMQKTVIGETAAKEEILIILWEQGAIKFGAFKLKSSPKTRISKLVFE